MNDKTIPSILKDVLEEEIPSSQVNLWPAVKHDLVAGKHQQNQQGDKMNTLKSRRISRPALLVPLALGLLIIISATPQGQTFAQNVVEFFTRSESTTFPVESYNDVAVAPGEQLPTSMPPAPLISAAEAKVQVGFEFFELPYVPGGFTYLGVRLYGNNVSMDYMTAGYGHLVIMQSQGGFYQSEWNTVPGDNVLPVKIGDLDGELVSQGSFVQYPGENIATWNPDASITRLRWVDSGISIEITLHGDAHHHLDLAGLIELAENLALQP